MMYFSSDLHFGHNKEFLYVPRGFKSIQEHDETIIKNFNDVLKPDDELYLGGDSMLGDKQHGLECLRQIHCHIYMVRGNHDTDSRIELYKNEPNITYLGLAHEFKYNKLHFLLMHYHVDTGNIDAESLRQLTIDLFGHTHQKTNFWQEIPFYYHIGLDSHNNYPVSIDQIIDDIKNKINDCKSYL